MTLREAAVVAGAVSTVLFLGAYLPMLAKAWRTRDLHSYSGGSLTVTTLGNLVYTAYVVSLPVGPIWACTRSTWSAPPACCGGGSAGGTVAGWPCPSRRPP